MILVKDLLAQRPVEASAPCRVDSGGTWDIKAFALPLEAIHPTTVNIALTLRTSAGLYPYKEGKVKISSIGFAQPEIFSMDRLPFHSPFGLFFAAISFFGFHGLEVRIDSQSPVKSALGGSSTALVALIKALSKVSVSLGNKGCSRKEILHLAYHLEDGISGGNCGIQDQAAAVYGGVHQWEWRYGNRTAPFQKTSLLNGEGRKELSKRLLVAYSGKSHTSSETNNQWVKDFLACRTRSGWIKANEMVQQFGIAIEALEWDRAASLLRKEMSLRMEITPEALTPTAKNLIDEAEDAGCGARFAGAGAGGSLWAVGTLKKIDQLKTKWETILKKVKGAKILHCNIDTAGVR